MTKKNAKGRGIHKVTGYSPHDIVTAADRRIAKRTAEELGYTEIMPDVMERIDRCETVSDINRVLRACRKAS